MKRFRFSFHAATVALLLASGESAGNPVLDPGFEEVGTGAARTVWRFVQHAGVRGYDFSADREVFRQGKQSLRITRVKPQFYGSALQAVKGLEPGVYLAQAQMRSVGVDDRGWKLYVRLYKADGASSAPNAAPLLGDQDWKQVQVEFLVDATIIGVEVGVTLEGAGAGWVDDVQILPARAAAAPTSCAAPACSVAPLPTPLSVRIPASAPKMLHGVAKSEVQQKLMKVKLLGDEFPERESTGQIH